MVTTNDIAKICHEANRAYCETMGDNSQKSWEEAPEWQRVSAILGVKYALKNPTVKPYEMHDKWMEAKKADGWVYGEIKDEAKKEHPCMVSYDKLPPEQQIKDSIFKQVVRALRSSHGENKEESPKGAPDEPASKE